MLDYPPSSRLIPTREETMKKIIAFDLAIIGIFAASSTTFFLSGTWNQALISLFLLISALAYSQRPDTEEQITWKSMVIHAMIVLPAVGVLVCVVMAGRWFFVVITAGFSFLMLVVWIRDLLRLRVEQSNQ